LLSRPPMLPLVRTLIFGFTLLHSDAVPDKVEFCKGNCKVDGEYYTLVRSMEGFSPFVYPDAVGNSTVCFGHLVHPGERFAIPMTGEQCEQLLEQDSAEAQRGVNQLVKVNLIVHQYDSLVDFTFNLGIGLLKRSGLLKKVNAGQHEQVPSELLKYNHAGAKILPGLTIRRHLEAELYSRP